MERRLYRREKEAKKETPMEFFWKMVFFFLFNFDNFSFFQQLNIDFF